MVVHRFFLGFLLAFLIVSTALSVPIASVLAFAPALPSPHRALILSSLEQVAPMGYYSSRLESELGRAGYQVSFLADRAVTLDFLTTQLNNYDVVIWRTNLYSFNHVDYWYVGEVANPTTLAKYASDAAHGWVDWHVGILGVNVGFFQEHFSAHSLANVKLIVLISSYSVWIGGFLVNAGAEAVIMCTDPITLSWGLIDDFTVGLFSALAGGDTVLDSVFNLVAPSSITQPRDPLDSAYIPPFWFVGDGTVIISHS
jgi:hypothetical protein